MALRANRSKLGTGAGTGKQTPAAGTGQQQQPAAGIRAPRAAGPTQPPVQHPAAPQQQAPPPAVTGGSDLTALNNGILENIDGMGDFGNYVTIDGSQFLYKATEEAADTIDIVVTYGKRYYQWVEEDGENKIFHDSDTRIDDRYKIKFELRWEEEGADGEAEEIQFKLPTASTMRFIDYVRELAKNGYGVGQVVTRLSLSRQQQKNSTNRYSRCEFTMVGIIDADGNVVETNTGITTVGKN